MHRATFAFQREGGGRARVGGNRAAYARWAGPLGIRGRATNPASFLSFPLADPLSRLSLAGCAPRVTTTTSPAARAAAAARRTPLSPTVTAAAAAMANYIHVPPGSPEVPKLDLVVSERDSSGGGGGGGGGGDGGGGQGYRRGALRLLSQLRPQWKPGEVTLKVTEKRGGLARLGSACLPESEGEAVKGGWLAGRWEREGRGGEGERAREGGRQAGREEDEQPLWRGEEREERLSPLRLLSGGNDAGESGGSGAPNDY